MARRANFSGTASVGATHVGVTGWTVTPVTDAVDVSGMDGAGFRSYVVGLSGCTGSCTMWFDTGGEPPSIKDRAVITAALTSDTSPGVSITGSAIVTQSEMNAAVDGAASATVNFTYTGSWTETKGWESTLT